MFKDTFINFFNKKIESNYIIQLIDVLYTPIVIFLVLFILYHVLRFIYYKAKEKKYHKKLASSGIRDIDKMDGLQFEFYLKALFKEMGFKSEVTKGSHDFGADLIMIKNKKKIVIQAKRYKHKNNVSVDAVQQTYTAIPYYKANEGWIITNSFFTKSAKKLASVTKIKLLDRHKLIDFINEIRPTTTAKQVANTVSPKERKCPECKNKLVKRTSKNNNHFMGCETYPKCTHTEPIAMN